MADDFQFEDPDNSGSGQQFQDFFDQFDRAYAKMVEAGWKPKEKKSPYPYPEGEEQKKQFAKMKEDLDAANAKIAEYENAEKQTLTEQLVDSEIDRGITNEENRGAAIEGYKNFSKEQLKSLLDKTGKVDKESIEARSFKSKEAGKKDSKKDKDFKSKEDKIKVLETRVKDFRRAGLDASAKEVEEELNALKEGA